MRAVHISDSMQPCPTSRSNITQQLPSMQLTAAPVRDCTASSTADKPHVTNTLLYYMQCTAAVTTGRHTLKSTAQADTTTGMASADASAAGDQAGAVPPNSSGFMGMTSGVGAAAHRGSPHKAAEMLSMSQSPTAEKVGGVDAFGGPYSKAMSMNGDNFACDRPS